MQHPATDTERPTQQTFGQGEIALGQHLAQPRAADALAAFSNGIGGFHGKAMALAAALQKGKVARAITTKAKIVTHFQVLDTQTIDQDLLHKLLGTHLTQTPIEGQAQHPVNAVRFQQCELVTQPRQARRRIARREVFARLGLEYDHATR